MNREIRKEKKEEGTVKNVRYREKNIYEEQEEVKRIDDG